MRDSVLAGWAWHEAVVALQQTEGVCNEVDCELPCASSTRLLAEPSILNWLLFVGQVLLKELQSRSDRQPSILPAIARPDAPVVPVAIC